MKKYLILTILILLNVTLFGQANRSEMNKGNFNGVLKGKVIDSSTKAPIDYANVTLYRAKDSTTATGGISNEKGEFLINDIKPGKYFAKVSFIGYKTNLINNILISPQSQAVELGAIKITSASIKMGTVVVKGSNDMVVTNLDKQVINVEKDLSSAGGTALDVMQNIPALTVDIDGNISLRGNSNVTILIDGKPTGLAGLNSSDVLTSIPASSIKSVELVTNPSAKYDPDGTAGIINIVLKKRSNLGFNGIFNLNAGTGDKYTGGSNFNYRTGDLNFFGDIDGRIFQFNRTGISNRTNFLGSNISYLNQNSSSGYNFNMANINLGSEYLFDDYNTLSLSVQYRRFHVNNSGGINNYLLNDQSALQNYFIDNSTGDRNVKALNYTLSYKRDFGEKGQQLTADIMYNNISMLSTSGTDYNYFTIDGNPATLPPSLINNTYNNGHKMFIVQSNYVQPLGENNRLEAGFKSSISDLGMNYNFFNFDPNNNEWMNNDLRSNNFDYKEQIHAVYGIYTGGLGNFKYQAGVRAEDAITSSKLITSGISYDSKYFSLYPSVYFAYDFTPLQEFKISYSRRVDRPKPWQLNPFTNYTDSLNLTNGNPNLQPEYTNSYEMGYSTIFFDFNIYTSLFLKQTSGLITQISSLVNNGITESTYENVSSEKNYGTELVANGSLFKWWRLNANASYFRADINDPLLVTGTTNFSYSWTGRINSTWNLDKSLSLQISSTYNSPIVRPQGKTDAIYFTDVAVKKDFLDGRLSATLRLSDIFNTRKYSSETYGNGFTSFNTGQRDSRILYLGITFNINNYKQQKDRVKDMNTDDDLNTD